MMHEFHAWIGLSESTEESDLGHLPEVIDELQQLAAESKWHDASFDIKNLNGQYFFTADGFVNRRREEGERLNQFLAIIARRLPGSWGLAYDRDDEMPNPPGPNGFRVRILARGTISERLDPFLSPCNPVMEDLFIYSTYRRKRLTTARTVELLHDTVGEDELPDPEDMSTDESSAI